MKGKLAIKIGVSLPAELHKALEDARRKLGKTRSALLQEALKEWLEARRLEQMVRRYQDGYLATPESAEEIRAAEAAAGELLAREDWS